MGFVVGCAAMLLVFAGSSFYYWELLSGRSASSSWFAIPLGVSVTLVFAQVWGLFSALTRLKLLNKSVGEWSDGEFVGISGPLRPLREAVTCPATGNRALAIEYSLERRIVQRTSNSNSVAYRKEVTGFLLAPCAVYQKSGPIRLVGFPRPEHFESATVNDSESLERFAAFLRKAPLTPLTMDPIAALRAFTSVLQDDEEEVSRHFCNSDSSLSIVKRAFNSSETVLDTEAQNARLDTSTPDEDTGDDQAPPHELLSDSETLLRELKEGNYRIQERWIPLGVTASVYGIYRKSQRALDVGTELTALQQGEVRPGNLQSNVYKGILTSLILLIFWIASAIVGHYLLVKEARDFIDARLPHETRDSIHGTIKSVLPEDSKMREDFR